MEHQSFTGVGCFAKPKRLARIFERLAQNYALGPFRGFNMFDGHLSHENEGVDLLQALIAGMITGSGSGDHKSFIFEGPMSITGFYLTFNDQNLKLSIFTRGNRSRPEIYTTSLDGLTKLRQKRLN